MTKKTLQNHFFKHMDMWPYYVLTIEEGRQVTLSSYPQGLMVQMGVETIPYISLLGQNVNSSAVGTQFSGDPGKQGIISCCCHWGVRKGFREGGDRLSQQRCQAGAECARGPRQGRLSSRHLQEAGEEPGKARGMWPHPLTNVYLMLGSKGNE